MMPFRQKKYSCCGGYAKELRMSVDASGRATMVEDDRELPSPETTKTSNLVNAGKDLGQFVNPMYKVEIVENKQEPQDNESQNEEGKH